MSVERSLGCLRFIFNVFEKPLISSLVRINIVGSSSEAIAQLETFGKIAYGGGGILISRGLFRAMIDQHQDCLEENKEVFGGDEIYSRW